MLYTTYTHVFNVMHVFMFEHFFQNKQFLFSENIPFILLIKKIVLNNFFFNLSKMEPTQTKSLAPFVAFSSGSCFHLLTGR